MDFLVKQEIFPKIVLDWAKDNLRVFPWRQSKNPYELLVVEILLQRTNAEQVKPVFEKFIKKYPTVKSLSFASVSEINEQIKSLGLRKRAVVLKKIALQIIEEYDGSIPKTRKELLGLYGVGPYVSNAVLCHAFGLNVPTVDVNFSRILVRVFDLSPKGSPQKDKKIWRIAEQIMTGEVTDPGSFNLAMIDIANEFCTTKKPNCNKCPLFHICAYGQNKIKNLA